VTEFIYRYNAPDRAHVFLSFQLETTSRTKEVAAVLDELERGGMKGCDISDDEMAKSHARYMIGGASDVPNERIFRFGETLIDTFFNFFTCATETRLTLTLNAILNTVKHTEFPERPGALRKFLSSLRNMGWNISLFHYRNHGAGKQKIFPGQFCSSVFPQFVH
jgi:threonine dehydratase